jgi:diguanylate cyclase (GGDEF)-like protein
LSSSWFGSRNPDIHVPALDAGDYTLEAIALDTPHARTSPIISMSFEVLPPWWRTRAFRGAIVLLAAILLGLIWRWQSNKLRGRRLALEAEYRERQSLLERATRDSLTGLWNRATILDVLARETVQAQRSGTLLAVGIIDVDNFKQINDTYGHPGGDEVLRVLSRRLGAQLRRCDWLGRHGGEELTMILPGLDRPGMEAAAERMRSCVSDEPFVLNGRAFRVTISVGMARCESPSDTVQRMIARADNALYEAKRAGRNRVTYAQAIDGGASSPPHSRHYVGELLDKLRREKHRGGHEPKEG